MRIYITISDVCVQLHLLSIRQIVCSVKMQLKDDLEVFKRQNLQL